MLVLSRKVNETLLITTPDGEEIRITLAALRGHTARFGVTAPRSYSIVREELVSPETVAAETIPLPPAA